jgi:hypothetical protein
MDESKLRSEKEENFIGLAAPYELDRNSERKEGKREERGERH